MSLTKLLVPTYSQLLKALSTWIEKAGKQFPEKVSLLAARLAPDMFPLSTQVRFSCLQAYEAVAWLKGESFPQVWHDLLEEGRQGGEQPGTLEEATARIRDTLSFIETLGPDAIDAGADRSIALKLPDGRIFDMTGVQYARDWALPQFYFHVMTAYAILRNQGVELGKADYVQHAFVYLRAESAPENN